MIRASLIILRLCVGELAQAEYVRDMINSFDLDAKIVTRKKTFVVYLKKDPRLWMS